MILVIDNYDSFTYNLVQNFGELNNLPKVIRNDELTVENIIFKEDSEYANLIVQINQQKVLQSELYTQIYTQNYKK